MSSAIVIINLECTRQTKDASMYMIGLNGNQPA